ncbi:MAG: hypothetical protein LAT78_12115 [Roseinatronobacter sp.]|nr:hypothetical protein [Roseinatronobacter sp.]
MPALLFAISFLMVMQHAAAMDAFRAIPIMLSLSRTLGEISINFALALVIVMQ